MRRPRPNFFDRPPPPEPDLIPVDQPAASESEVRWKPASLYRFFEAQGISADTVDRFGCYVATHRFPASGDVPAGEYPAIVIPHQMAGQERNRRLRAPSGTVELLDDPACPWAFNIDSLRTPDVVWVTPTELDAMALIEANPQAQIIALMDGRDGDGRRSIAALKTHAEALSSVKRFVLCGGGLGDPWVEDIAARIGRHRCQVVEWPQETPSAAATLAMGVGGIEAVQAVLARAEPYPIEGLETFDGTVLVELRKRNPPEVMRTGTRATDMILKLPTEGKLIVTTGIPGHGKSSWLRFVMVHTMQHHDRKWCVFSPEMAPWPEYVASCAEVLLGKRFWRRRGFHPEQFMGDDEMRMAGDWLGKRLTMLTTDSQDTSPDLDWLFDRAAMSVLRDGTTDFLLDPWNEVEHTRGDMTEAEYANRALQRCRAFGTRHGANFWIAVHPIAMRRLRNGDKPGPPGKYDVSGGAAWANKPDVMVTVNRTEDVTEIHVLKTRATRWGKPDTMAKILYDAGTGRYYDEPATLLDGMRGNEDE